LPPALVAWRHEHARRGAPDSAACGGAGGTKAAACGGGSEAVRGAGDALWALLPRFALVMCPWSGLLGLSVSPLLGWSMARIENA